MPNKRIVGINDKGRRIGEDHPGAKFSDHDYELMTALREAGLTYKEIAAKMECSYDTVKSFFVGRRRCQHAARFKRIR